jgi:hypothetical protein
MQSRPEKLVRWFLFNVLISLTPLITSFMGLQLDSQPYSVHALTARGELLLISTTIASAAVGELIPSGRGKATLKLVAGGGCVLLVMLCSLFFAAIQARQNPDPGRVFATSAWLFAGTLLASFGSVYLAYEGETPS